MWSPRPPDVFTNGSSPWSSSLVRSSNAARAADRLRDGIVAIPGLRVIGAPDATIVAWSCAPPMQGACYGMPMQVAPMIGGSGPNHAFIEELGVPIVCAGLGYGDTRAHAPDENFRIDLYVKHAKHVARLMEGFASAK